MRRRPPALALALLAGTQAFGAAAQQFDTDAWNKPGAPFRVIGPIHFVGTAELAAFLLTTPAGHILVDGGLPESAPLIEQSIRALGKRPEDIRVLLTTQAHFDHVGSLAHFQRLSGARVEVMEGDVDVVESGGRTDYLFGDAGERTRFPPVKVDRTLHDGDSVVLGGLALTARKAPGHTRGSTAWLTRVEEGGHGHSVIFAASTTLNPGTRLLRPASYPGIASDFLHAFTVLESLSPDVFLGSHTGFFGMEGKRARLGQAGEQNPFVDPAGYREHLRVKRAAFDQELARQRAPAAGPAGNRR